MDGEIRGSQFILPNNNKIKSFIILMCCNFDVLGQIKCIEKIKEIKSSAVVAIINSEFAIKIGDLAGEGGPYRNLGNA